MARKKQKRGEVQKAKEKSVDKKHASQLRKAIKSASKAANKAGKQLDKAMESFPRYEKTGNHSRLKGQLEKAISEYDNLQNPVETLKSLVGNLQEQ
jgi:hypothetical protein